MTVIDLNQIEAGQENWLAVIARQKREAAREEHKRRLMAGANERHNARKKKAAADLRASEFICFQKTLESKIARAMVKTAFAQQHARVEQQASKELEKYFSKSVRQIVSAIGRFEPLPDNAKSQAAKIMASAFKASKQNDLLIASASQPVADAFLEGAYAEMRLSAAAKRRKKFLEQEATKLTTASEAAARAEDEIDFPTEAPDWLTESAQDFIIETFHEPYWLRIPETTRDDIELTLYNAIAEGKSIRDISEAIQDAHGEEYNRFRATMVARTEVGAAMNCGAQESIRQAYEESGLTPTKSWLSVLGTTTRDDHADADGQEVGLDEEFTVGGEQCSYPGDARLSAGQRINCQCAIISGEVESQIQDEPNEERAFDPDQPRDEHGQWTSGGGSSGAGEKLPPLQRASADFTPANPEGKTSKDRYHKDGKYTAERRELHDAIVAKAIAGHEESSDPTMYMLGGGTAAGKSSALASGAFGIPTDVVHIDSDGMKAQLPDYKEMVAAGNKDAAAFAHKESSDVSVQLIKSAATKKLDAIVDTTGDNGLEYLEAKVAEMKQSGHKVIAHYVTVDTDTAVARATARAKETGREVAESVIRSIHKSVSDVLPKAVERNLFDSVTLWDTNESGSPRKVMSAAKGEPMQVHDEALWQRFLDKAA